MKKISEYFGLVTLMVASFASVSMAQGTSQVTKFLCRFPTYDSFGTEEIKVANENILSNLENCDLDDSDYPIVYKCTLHGEEISLPTGYPDYSCTEYTYDKTYFCLKLDGDAIKLKQSDVDLLADGYTCFEDWFTELDVSYASAQVSSRNVSGGVLGFISENSASADKLVLESDIDFGEMGADGSCNRPFTALISSSIKTVDGDSHKIKNLCNTSGGFAQSPYGNGYDAAPVNINFKDITFETARVHGGVLAESWGGSDGSSVVSAVNVTVDGAVVTAASGTAGGLTGFLEPGSVLDGVTVSNVTVEGESSYDRVGGIAGAINADAYGYAYSTSIMKTRVMGTNSLKGKNAGGLIGYISHNADVTISNSKVSGVTVKGSYAGGMVGFIEPKASSVSVIFTSDTTDQSTVTAAGYESYSARDNLMESGVGAKAAFAGGLIGAAQTSRDYSGDVQHTLMMTIEDFLGTNLTINTDVAAADQPTGTDPKKVFLGGVAGYMFVSGDGMISRKMKVSSLSITNNEIDAESYMGGIYGQVTAKGTKGATNFAKDTVTSATLSKGAYAGGFIGHLYGADAYSGSSAVMEDSYFSGAINPSCGKRSAIGGFVGYFEAKKTDDSYVDINKSVVEADITENFGKCGTDDVAGIDSSSVGGLVGRTAENNRARIRNTYLKGNITYSAPDGLTTAWVGGILGSSESYGDRCIINDKTIIYSTYRITTDDVITGVGVCTEDEWHLGVPNWSASIGNESVKSFLNLRTSTGTSTGPFGYRNNHLYTSTWGDNDSYSILKDGSSVNGEVSQDVLKSDIAAAVFNTVDGVWTRSEAVNEGYPSFADDENLPIYTVVFDLSSAFSDYAAADDPDAATTPMPSEMQDLLDRYEPYEYYSYIVNDWSSSRSSYMRQGVVAYTNNKGQLPAALVADMKTVADNSYWVGKVGTTDYKLNSTETYSAPLVYTLTPKKTYQFVYRNCFYDGGMVCYSSDEGGFFLSAALDEVSDDGSNDWTLLPTFWNTIDNQYYDAVLLIKETDFTANVVNAAGEDAFDASNIIAGETIYTYGALIDYLVKGNVPSTEPLYFVYINSSTRSNAASAQLVVRSSGLYDKWVGNINYYNAGTDQILPQKLSYEKAAINDSKNPVYVPLTNNLSFDFVAPGYTYDGYKASFVIGGATPAKTDAPTYFAGKNEFQALINDSKYEAGWTTELLDAGTPLNMDSVAIGKGRLMESAAATLTSQLIIEPVLTKIPYTVTFNLDAFTDVYYGDDETETECAKGTAAEGACPKKYVINDVYFPRKIYGAVNVAGEKSYQKVQWRVNENDDNGISVLQLTVNNLREKTADELNSLTETEKLDYINKYIQSTADADGNYSFTMYGFAEANVKLASSMYLEMLGVASAYDKDDPSQNVKDFVLTDEADYHGHFEISQKYGAGVDDVSTHTSTWSRIMDMGSPNYKDWSHNILIPGANDTLYFDVKFVPDAGYDIEYISYETTASGYSAGPAPGKPENPFGYDNDTKKLVLNPYLVNMAAFYVKFISNDYNVSFTAPEEGMYITGDDWGRDWTSPQAYSAADINKDFPKIYALDKCYGWSPSVTPEELPDEWPFPATKLTEEVMKYLSLGTENTLVLEELVPCNPRTKSITVSSKFGTVTLSQVIGDGENVYPFKEGGYTRVPSTVEGIPFQIKIEPLESYVVKSITYSFRNQYNNLESTLLDYDPEYLPGIVVQGLHDSPSIDVEYYAPGSRFVKYDLGIGETDSAEVYFPEDALLTQTFTMEDANETKPWQPYRVGKHFKGWSLTPESDVVDIDLYSLIDADLISRLSMKENYPTTLYAVWDENFDGGQVMFDLEQGDVEHGSVKVYQEWDGKKIYHDISDAVTLVYKQEGESYLFGVEAIPDAGYENAGVSVVRLCADGLDAERCEGTTFTPDDNGIYSILAAWTSAVDVASTIRVSATFAKTAYNFAFNMGNAPSSVYKTSEWIDSKDNMQLDEVFPEGVARTDACFGGWAFADGESVGFSKLSGDDFFAALAAATPEKQTVPPADPDGEAGEIDVYNLYPVWTTTDCAPKTVKVASSNAPSSGKFVLTQGAIKLDVTAAGVTVPADAKMDVQFVVGAGASVDAAVTYDVALLDADGEPVNEGLNDSKLTPVDNVASYTFAGSVAVTDDELEVVSYNLSATVEYDEMTVVFDVNAGDEDVFYGSDWKKTATYSMDMAADELKLPKNIYRSYIRLLGWSFSTDEDANIYTAFDSDMVGEYIEAKAASADGSVTLFARWDESEGPQVYTVVNGMSEKGVLHLAQTVGTEEVPYVVEQGMQIPVAAETEFTVTYEPKPGYKVVSFKATDLQGVEIADAITTTIAADVVVGTFSLNKDIVIVAVLEAAGYEIVLDANVEADAEDPLFYGSDWESVKEFDLTDNKELPTNLYRSGHKVTGWTMTLDADAPVYKEFNATLEAAATAAATGDVPEKLKLYAHWEASSETAMTVKSANSAEEGSLKIFQAVEGNNTTPMVVPAEGLVVPVGLNDVQLVAVFSPAEDFTLTDDFYMFVKADGADSAALEKVADGAAFALARNVSIMAPVIQKNYKFAFDVNAGDANVFYDNALPETATYNVDAEEADRVLPTGIYRAGKTLDGWALSANATSGVKVFDAAFVSKVLASDAPDAAGVRTLYAVWTASTEEPIVVTVDVENASSGTMKLYQVLGDAAADKVELALVNNQVSVPAVAGMKISADFTLADNFEFTDATPIVVTAASATADDEPAVYANGSAFEVTENVTISVNVKTDRPTFAFDANANGGMVYYVGD
ncbi:MAG: hypothetical protein MJZ26_05700, partial [Fibrobacter sp.]|nr:hypothetical protein [Fibrobacter sp.]